MATAWKYLPILKWKQGERIALRELTATQWDGVVPLIELMPLTKVAPGAAGFRGQLSEALRKVANQVGAALPEDRSFAIDTVWIAPTHPRPAHLLRQVVDGLRSDLSQPLLPVLTPAMVTDHTPDLAAFKGEEVVLRVQTRELAPNQLAPLVGALVDVGLPKSRIHLLLDQDSMVNEAVAGAVAAALTWIGAAKAAQCASVTLAGGSFPINLMGIKQGSHDLPRVEWNVWQQVRGSHPTVRYSDYAVTNPAPIPDMDPTQVNPSVAIRYASDNFWRLFKAGGFKKGKPDQYRTLCQLLLTDPVYSGSAFSYGDGRYDAASKGLVGNGNPSSWRRDATSHHLVFVAKQVAGLSGAAGTP